MKQTKTLVADFETTVWKGQTYTEVWASACVELYTEDVHIFHSLDEQWNYLVSLKSNVICYFHNLKFDGSFLISYFLIDKKFEQAVRSTGDEVWQVEFLEDKYMKNNTFKYSISDMGQWYTLKVKVGGKFIEFRDSLKLLPFSLARIGKSFKTKHKKLSMEYTGFRYAGCTITDEEKEYIKNDVLVIKEALEIMFNEGHNKLTIGACCLSEYKNICKTSTKLQLEYEEMFPNLYEINIKKETYGSENAGEYIRRSYGGGWCYLAKGKENKVYGKGITADVNSLYPSMMHSQSGNKFPIGLPNFWSGDYLPDEAIGDNKYFFVRVKTRFYIRDGMLPFIHIRNSFLYKATDCLETSDIIDEETGKSYVRGTHPKYGEFNTTQIMTMTMTDYYLFLEHYEPVDFQILDGCWFYSIMGLFDEYIDKYAEIKKLSKGAKRELAKLFLNNLYGKMASSTNSAFKYAYIKPDNTIGFYEVKENKKKPGYIPVGSAITSYARNFTIRTAQKNYYGVDKAGFIYADTDSIHCDLEASDLKGLTVHDKNFCCWKLEATWDTAVFTRQKTYIEHVVEENLQPIEKPFYNIKCAGMPQRCKDLFETSLKGTQKIEDNYTDDERKFLFNEDGTPIIRRLSDFKVGLEVPSKLLPKRILGGILLTETSYKMR